MGWLGRSLGQFGADVGTGHDIALDWKQREQDMRIKAAQQKLQEMMLPLQLQEIQARLAEMTQPKPAGLVGTHGGGQAGVTFQPGKGYSLQTLEEGADPAAVKSQIQKMVQGAPKEFQSSIQSHIDAIDAGADPMKELAAAQKDLEVSAAKAAPTGTTLNRLQARADEQLRSGDLAGYADTQKEITSLAKAGKPQNPTYWNRVAAAQQGDPDAAAQLKMDLDKQMALVKQRGMAFGQGRLFALQNTWEDGVPGVMTGFEVLQARNQGRNITIGGPLDAKTRIAYQQLYAEAGPALAAVESNLKAFDNPSDKAIFARVLANAGTPAAGEEESWFRNWSAQLLKSDSGLSADGRQVVPNIARLGETMGRFRGIAGLPATDSSMAVTMLLVPGPTTPDSSYARMQTNILRSMITQAGGIPAMRGQGQGTLTNPTGTGGTPPPGSKIISLDDFLKGKTQ